MPTAQVICSGLVERIGLPQANISYKVNGIKHEQVTEIPNHKEGLELVSKYLMDKEIGVIGSTEDISAIGHRVVHGGNSFSNTVLIDDAVKKEIRALFSLAPLHNPANLEGIEVAEQIFKRVKQIAVFDTAFHQTIPVEAYKYAIPNMFLDDHHVRLYGFHGTSHKYVSKQAISYLGKEKAQKIISIHLGNGCSMTAIKSGESIDHSLGFAPMNGLIMGTRSGDIDPSVIFYLMDSLGYSKEKVNTLLQKKSGMLGLTGFSDMRDIIAAAETGNEDCKLALTMNAYRIKKYIGSYISVLNGLDAIIFTAGIGENAALIRSMSCDDLDCFGILIDEDKNNLRSGEIREVQANSSKVKILVIPTNEELEIAEQTFEIISQR